MAEINENTRIGLIYKVSGYDLESFGETIDTLDQVKPDIFSKYLRWVCNGKSEIERLPYFVILDKGNDWVVSPVKFFLTDIYKTGLVELKQSFETK